MCEENKISTHKTSSITDIKIELKKNKGICEKFH